MERSADGTRVLLIAYSRTKLGSVPLYLWDMKAFDCGWIHSILESNRSALPMLRWCSWTYSDRHSRNWNYLRICRSLWRAVVATCKSKHLWQSNRTWGTTAYSTREPRHFHPFVPISIWQPVSLGLICRATHWCRDLFVLHCSPASPLLPNKPVTCK